MAVPGKRPIARIGHELAAAALLAASNIALNRLTPPLFAVPAGLAAAAGSLLLAAKAGAGLDQLGLAPSSLRRGARAGLIAGVPIGTAVALAAFLPQTRRLFRDQRIADAAARDATYQLLVRIPLATAVTEEIIFRSSFEGSLSTRHSVAGTVLISSALFGAWHILPALDRTLANTRIRNGDMARKAGAVAAVVAVTAAAGIALSWLRRRTDSVIAPILVHYAVNAGGYLGVWLTSRRERANSLNRSPSADDTAVTPGGRSQAVAG